MPGFLEPLPSGSSLLRVGPHCITYGDDWTLAVVVAPYDPTCPTVKGAMRAPTPSEWRAVAETLHQAGYKWFMFDRMTSNGAELHVSSTHNRRAVMKAILSLKFENDAGKQTSKAELELNDVDAAKRLDIEDSFSEMLSAWRTFQRGELGKK